MYAFQSIELSCIFNPKTHLICNQPVFIECCCLNSSINLSSIEQHEIANRLPYISCLKCMVDQCDYTGKFKCPNKNCSNELRKSLILNESDTNLKLAEFKKSFDQQIRTNLNTIIINLLKKANETSRDLTGKQKSNPEDKPYRVSESSVT